MYARLIAGGSDFPASRYSRDARPTANAQRAIRPLTPRRGEDSITAARTFSKIRGAPHMKFGCVSPRPLTMRSILPSTAVLKPMPSWMVSRSLPNTCDSGSHRYCRALGLISSSSLSTTAW